MSILPALIKGGASILGGLLGRSKPISAGTNAYSHVGGIMRAAKEYGFNPLTLLGAVSPVGGTPADNSSVGQGIANAGMVLADAMSAKQARKAQMEKINQYQTRLKSKLDAITIRQPVPGIFGGVKLPSDPKVYGDENATRGDPRLSDPVALPDGASGGVGVPEQRLDRGSGGYIGGYRWEPTPGWSPTQVIEDEYGDVASWGYGLGKLATDVGHNAGRWLKMSDWSPIQRPYWKFKRPPDGYTADRRPFWKDGKGGIVWDYAQ